VVDGNRHDADPSNPAFPCVTLLDNQRRATMPLLMAHAGIFLRRVAGYEVSRTAGAEAAEPTVINCLE